MKKIIFITAALAFSCTLSFAQDKTTADTEKAKSFIGITGGYANAMGNFTKSDYDDEKSGYSNSSGYNLGIDGAYFFQKNFGIGGAFSTTSFYARGLQTM